jgi:putative NIF3 family GTP cyclohydrolase 1 type 2
VALDVTPEIVREAIATKADLIVTHHPLLFRPASSVSDADPVGALVLMLAEKRIALFSAHTNLDSAVGGVSFTLAGELGIDKPAFLVPLKDTLMKVAVFVPEQHADVVATAMAEGGAGVLGEYRSCSFRTTGKGTFRSSEYSSPTIGKPLQLETVDEVRLEMIVPRSCVTAVVAAMKYARERESQFRHGGYRKSFEADDGSSVSGTCEEEIARRLTQVFRFTSSDGTAHCGVWWQRI